MAHFDVFLFMVFTYWSSFLAHSSMSFENFLISYRFCLCFDWFSLFYIVLLNIKQLTSLLYVLFLDKESHVSCYVFFFVCIIRYSWGSSDPHISVIFRKKRRKKIVAQERRCTLILSQTAYFEYIDPKISREYIIVSLFLLTTNNQCTFCSKSYFRPVWQHLANWLGSSLGDAMQFAW